MSNAPKNPADHELPTADTVPPVLKDTPAGVQRRGLVAALLGAVGVGAASAMAACVAEGGPGPEKLGQAMDEFTTAPFYFTSVGVLGGSAGATMRGTPGNSDHQIAVLEGYYTPGDGGGGVFYWSTSGSDDGGTVFAASTSDAGSPAGYWCRIYSGPLDVRWFGAKGDGVTPDDVAIQAAINAANTPSTLRGGASGAEVKLGTGVFLIGNTLQLGPGTSLIGAGDGPYCINETNDVPTGVTTLRYTGNSDAILVSGAGPWMAQLRLADFMLTTITNSPQVGPGINGIRVQNAVGVRIERVTIRGFGTNGTNGKPPQGAGLLLDSSGTSEVLSLVVHAANIYENVNGLVAQGTNGTINHLVVQGCRIRANIYYNVLTQLQCLGWLLTGNDFEAGGTGNGIAGLPQGAVYVDGPNGLQISGNYFEQVMPNALAIEVARVGPAYGVDISGNFIQSDTGMFTAIKLGTPGSAYNNSVYGVSVHGNFFGGYAIGVDPRMVVNGTIGPNFYNSSVTTPVNAAPNAKTLLIQEGARTASVGSISADRGDASVTLTVGTDVETQQFASSLTTDRTITLSTAGAAVGDRFRVVRTGLGPGHLIVGSLKTIPANTAAFVEVAYASQGWVLMGYGLL